MPSRVKAASVQGFDNDMQKETFSTKIPLPEPELLPSHSIDFLELVELRQSVRTYSQRPLRLVELSYLLWCTQGIKTVLADGRTLRNVPSSKGLHALETWLLVRHVENLEAGIYRYDALAHALEQIHLQEDLAEVQKQILAAFPAQSVAHQGAVLFIWLANVKRALQAHDQNLFRAMDLDTGHVSENLYLAAQVLHLGTCATDTFAIEPLLRALELRPERYVPTLVSVVGKY